MKHLLTLTLLTLGLIAQAQIPSYVPTNGLVGWWPFNGNANDESGNGNHGTVNGATLAADRFGNVGKAYSFDGSGKNIAASCNGFSTGERTISLWFYGNDIGQGNSGRGLIGYGGNGNCGTSCLIVIDNAAQGGNNYEISGHCNNQAVLSNYGQIHPNNLWKNWIITVSNSGTSFFINGQLVKSDPTFINQTYTNGKSLFFGIGIFWDGINSFYDSNVMPFNGLLDDIAIYNRALSASEVQQLYLGACAKPAFTAQPQNKSVAQGQTTTFAVQVDSAKSYQWQMNLGLGAGWANIPASALFSGDTTATLSVQGRSTIDGAQFRCIATSCNADTSNAATLTVTSSGTAAAGTVAGVPGLINYQGSALDSAGKPMKNQTISLKLSVLDSSSTGATVYVESHSASTNGSGHFAIQIGGGTAILGTFDSVGWANGRNKYLKTELSQNGTWVNLGTSQLVSVPYALHAGSAEVAKSAEQLQVGTLVRGNSGQSYQLEIGNNGPVWTCSPSVPQANAGPDQLNICGDTVILNGNSYNGVNSSWKILTGTGGNILGNLFTGIRGKSYSIQYSLTNVCGSSFDTLLISLALPIIQASAGTDQLNICSNNVTLRGNTAPGTGSSWSVFSGFGGTVVGNTFTGIRGNAYSLRYTLTNVCGTSLDTLLISLALPVSQADAGAEQRIVCGDTVTLGGNTFAGTTSNWSIIFSGTSGTSGTIIGNTFTGTRGYSYSLVYALSNSCGSSFDTMQIFLALPASQSIRANAGPDQITLPSTMAHLAANTPAFGETGFWTIISGMGATLGNANDPASTITKGNDSTYTLVWTINNPCIISYDTVIVLFQNLLMNVACPGIPSVNYGGTMYPTVQIGTQCWLAKNLDVGNMIPGAFNQTNNAIIEKYCYDNDTSNCTTYGGLYQWGEAMQYLSGNVRGICPTGWHISSDWEWCTLTKFLDITVDCSTIQSGTDVGNKLRSTSSLWYGNNSGATNVSGFSALPGGFRNTVGTFENRVGSTTFWTSLDIGIYADYRSLSSGNSSISHDSDLKSNGFSIRCLKD